MNILVLAPHTDDEVVGCGGLIHNQIRKGVYVKVVAFSKIFSCINLRDEFLKAAKILKVSDAECDKYSFKPRYFDGIRQEIRDALIELRNERKWDWILVPQRNDPHQDHQVVTEETIRIFNAYTILGYECPGKSRRPVFDLVVKLDEEDIRRKVSAFAQFISQKHRFYYKHRENFFLGRAADRGALIETEYAEAFEVIRMVM